MKRTPEHTHTLLLSCFSFAKCVELVYVQKLIGTVVSGTLPFFTHNNWNSSLGGCCPIIVMSQVCYVLVAVTEPQPLDEWDASRHLGCLLSPRYFVFCVKLDRTAHPYVPLFCFFHLVDQFDNKISNEKIFHAPTPNNILHILISPLWVMDRSHAISPESIYFSLLSLGV